jgi:hypothetical protein
MTEIEIKTKLRIKGMLIILLQILFIPYSAILGFFLFYFASVDDGMTFYISYLLFGFIIDALFIFIIITAFKKTINNVTFVTISKQGIKIRRPLKFYSQYFDWSEIKGYSKTDYIYMGGKASLCCKAIIIYTKSKMTYEIIEVYNSNYLNFQKYLNNFKVVYFGTEKYERGRFGKRKNYKFLELYNN